MQWTLIVCITNAVCTVPGAWAQYGVPVPVYAVPPPVMPVLVPALVVQQGGAPATTTTTTTTTTPRSVAVAVPVPVPVGVPYAVNAMPAFPPVACQARARPPNCPPCPPCVCLPTCTPAFFSYCSPCHQRCRCRDPAEAPPPPVPVAMPMPAPPPVVVMPFQPSIRLPKLVKKTKVKKRDPCTSSSDTSGDTITDESSSYESLGSSDLDIYYKRARKRRKRRKRIFARRKDGRSSDSEVVKPVLSYVSENGDVKFKKKISNADATWLLDKEKDNRDKEQVGTVHWLPDAESVALARSLKQIVVKNDKTKGILRQDKKKIVFRPPANKKISNLTVSFQVAE